MKGDMIYSIFLIVLAALGGILTGTNLQANFVREKTTGANWTGLVVGITIALMASVMVKVGSAC